MLYCRQARVAELVDAHGSGPCIARCGDSSSLPGTSGIQIGFQFIFRRKTTVYSGFFLPVNSTIINCPRTGSHVWTAAAIFDELDNIKTYWLGNISGRHSLGLTVVLGENLESFISATSFIVVDSRRGSTRASRSRRSTSEILNN